MLQVYRTNRSLHFERSPSTANATPLSKLNSLSLIIYSFGAISYHIEFMFGKKLCSPVLFPVS